MMERFRWTYIEKTLAPTESNHHMSHKLAAFNVMIHRMINVPLSAQNFDKEYEKIIHIGEVNGANKSVIDIHIKKNSGTSVRRFWTQVRYQHIRLTVKHFQRQRYCTGFTQCKTKLKSMLNTTKYRTNDIDQPGIYSATCSDCKKEYIGQTRCSLKVRKREHILHTMF